MEWRNIVIGHQHNTNDQDDTAGEYDENGNLISNTLTNGRFNDLDTNGSKDNDDINTFVDPDSIRLDEMRKRTENFDKNIVISDGANGAGGDGSLAEQNIIRYFKLPFPQLGFEVTQRELEPNNALRSKFPWIPYSREHYEQLSISLTVAMYQKGKQCFSATPHILLMFFLFFLICCDATAYRCLL